MCVFGGVLCYLETPVLCVGGVDVWSLFIYPVLFLWCVDVWCYLDIRFCCWCCRWHDVV